MLSPTGTPSLMGMLIRDPILIYSSIESRIVPNHKNRTASQHTHKYTVGLLYFFKATPTGFNPRKCLGFSFHSPFIHGDVSLWLSFFTFFLEHCRLPHPCIIVTVGHPLPQQPIISTRCIIFFLTSHALFFASTAFFFCAS